MAFNIYTLAEWSQKIQNGFKAAIPGSDAWLKPNNLYVSAKVFGAACFEIMLRLRWVVDQAFAVTASNAYLDKHGAEWGVPRKPARFAEGNIVFSGAAGSIINIGAIVTRTDGVRYELIEAVTIGANLSGLGLVRALEFGALGNTPEGASFTISSPPFGISSLAYASADGLSLGADEEDMEDYRARILDRKRNPPAAGAPSDYVRWALQVPGCTRAFVARCGKGPGTVVVYPLFEKARVNGIPHVADLMFVREHILEEAPSQGEIHVIGVEPHVVDVVVEGLLPNTPEMREIVKSEIQAVFHRYARPSTSGSYGNATPLAVSYLWQAVANATREQRHIIASPKADIVAPVDALPVLGAVTFV
jgi:uncharacterized phage protein gp47/JayE